MALDGKIPKKEKASKKNKDAAPEIIDFTSSVDQNKCSRQLSTIFNILDHQKASSKKREDDEVPELDQPMVVDSKIENEEENEIYTKTNMSEEQLREEVANSGYKVFK